MLPYEVYVHILVFYIALFILHLQQFPIPMLFNTYIMLSSFSSLFPYISIQCFDRVNVHLKVEWFGTS